LEQKVAFLHDLAGREVDLAQKPIEARSYFDFARSSHQPLIFEDFGRGLLLDRGLTESHAGQRNRQRHGGEKSWHPVSCRSHGWLLLRDSVAASCYSEE